MKRLCWLTMLMIGCFLVGCDMLPGSEAPAGMAEVSTDTGASVQSTQPAEISGAIKPASHIALLLPQQGDYANAGKAIQQGFNDALKTLAANNKPAVINYDTAAATVDIHALYNKAADKSLKTDMIIGPLEKPNVAILQSRENLPVLTIALNNPESGDKILSPNLYEFALSPIDEANQLADKAFQDGHRAALLITPQGNWGENIAKAINTRWEANGGVMKDRIALGAQSEMNQQIRQLLHASRNARRQDIDVIFMIAQPRLARQIKPLLKFYNASDIPVYSTSLVYSGLVNSAADEDLNGVMFCDMPLVIDQTGHWADVRQQLTLAQSANIQQYIRLYGLGWDAATLSQSFAQLPDTLDGATGKLYLDSKHHILRKLGWAVFKNGVAVPLD